MLAKLLLPLAIALALPAHAADPQEIELHFRPLPGIKQRLNIGMNISSTMDMLPGAETPPDEAAKIAERRQQMGKGFAMDMALQMRAEASEVDAKGDYLMHIRGEGGQLKLRMPDGQVKDMPAPQAELEMDALLNTQQHTKVELLRMKGLSVKLDAAAQQALVNQMLQQLGGQFAELEGRKLKIGESAEIPFNMQMPMAQLPQNMKMSATIKLTLKSVHQGVAHFDEAVQMQFATAGDASAPTQPKITATGSGKGALAYRLAERIPLRNDLDMTMNIDTELPGKVDMKMAMLMKMRMKSERLD
ncbi:hypothetical protein ACFJGW_10250 [Burkholderiaceae bacterium UC74_6]